MDIAKELETKRLGKGANAAFEKLKAEMGPRGATFLGRTIDKDDTLADVLKRIPAAEMEEAGSTMRSVMSPQTNAHGMGQLDPLMSFWQMLDEPFLKRPGGMIKMLRRKLQEYKDPEGEIMAPRPPQGNYNPTATLLAQMHVEQYRQVDEEIQRQNIGLRIRKREILENPAYWDKKNPSSTRLGTELMHLKIALGEFVY